MGGYDPYSSSKGCAELVASSYRRAFMQEQGIGLASARAGNVIGGGDWADDRLIPDILRSFEKNESVIIRNPKATRPWQHVLEPLSGYLILAEKLFKNQDVYAEGWNFGPNEQDVKPVDWILGHMIKLWPGASWRLNLFSIASLFSSNNEELLPQDLNNFAFFMTFSSLIARAPPFPAQLIM